MQTSSKSLQCWNRGGGAAEDKRGREARGVGGDAECEEECGEVVGQRIVCLLMLF